MICQRNKEENILGMNIRETLKKITEMTFSLVVAAFFIVFFAIVFMLILNAIAWWASYLGFV